MRALVGDLRRSGIAAGARTMRGALRDVAMRNGRIESVELEGGDSLRARLFVDASGMGGALRTRVLGDLCPPVERNDVCAAAEAQFRVRDRDGLAACLARHGVAPGDSIAFLSVAGGYSTLTLFTEPSLTEIGVLAGSIPATGAPNGAALLAAFSERAAWLGERLYGGQAAIPLRRPYAILGRAGVALVGDAACQVYATHGSGVGMGLCAGALLADAVEGDPGSEATLERYTQRFHRRYGGILAASDAFRRLSQSLPRQTIARLLEAGILDARTLASGIEQRLPSPDAAWLLERAARSLRAPRTVARVGPTVLRMLALSALGPLAPSPRTAFARGYEALLSALVGSTGAAPVDQVNMAAVLG
jgi:flavin-dependent dehydrogenase